MDLKYIADQIEDRILLQLAPSAAPVPFAMDFGGRVNAGPWQVDLNRKWRFPSANGLTFQIFGRRRIPSHYQASDHWHWTTAPTKWLWPADREFAEEIQRRYQIKFEAQRRRDEAAAVWRANDAAKQEKKRLRELARSTAFKEKFRRLLEERLNRPPVKGKLPGVYLIASGDYIKIGYATDLANRIDGLQVGSPHALQPLYLIPGPRSMEADFHSLFNEHRYRGEWFRHQGALKDFISDLTGLPTAAKILSAIQQRGRLDRSRRRLKVCARCKRNPPDPAHQLCHQCRRGILERLADVAGESAA